MQELTLEKEFNIYKNIHEQNTLKADIARHFLDLYKTGVQIPNFMWEKTPQEMFRETYWEVISNPNKQHVHELYEEAYKRNVQFIKNWGERL